MKLEFKNPPTDARTSNGEMTQVADALKANPGEWALIGRKSPSTAAVIKNGLTKAFRPAGSFDSVTRNGDGRKADIYARYIGDAS